VIIYVVFYRLFAHVHVHMSQLNLVVMLHSLFVALSSSKSELVLPVTNSTFPLHAIWQDFRNI